MFRVFRSPESYQEADVLTLTFLGVGDAFAKRNHNSNALVEVWATGPESQDAPDDVLLIDFGITGPLALHGLSQRDEFDYLRGQDGRTNFAAVRRVFVSHLHGDHIGGLEELCGMCAFFSKDPQTGEPHKPVLHVPLAIADELWTHSLSAGLRPFHGTNTSLSSFFQVDALPEPANGVGDAAIVLAGRYEFCLVRTDHVRIAKPYDWPSYGLFLRDRESGESALYSGDSRMDPKRIVPLMENARVCFHDAMLMDLEGTVHATVFQLRGLSEDLRRKTHLYHFGDAFDDPQFQFVAKEFAGFARPQVRYRIFD